jgi:T5SS/PEP-CTERM-associated repeat protein
MKHPLIALDRGNYAPLFSRLSLTNVLFAAVIMQSAALGAISTVGNVSPAYPVGSPDPWQFENELRVGDSTNGVLTVDANSDVASIGSIVGGDPNVTGLITVSGDGSSWANGGNLYLGLFGNGTLNVLDGAVVDTGRASLGHSTGSGLVIVNGPDSLWTNSDQLIVGNGAEGVLRIQDQGRVINGYAVLGATPDAHGSVSVEGEGAAWEVFQSLTLGKAQNGGSGTVSLATGGNRIYVGAAAVRNADQIPSGQTALVVSEEGGVATLEMFGGSQLQNAGNAYVANGAGETGTVSITGAGSHWNNQGDVSIGAGGPGLLSVANGAQFTTMGVLTIASNGTLHGNGSITGDIINAGIVLPGNPVGGLSVAGDYSQSNAGTLRIDLNGRAAGQFDSLNLIGAASINGSLEVTLGQTSGVPYVPQVGDAFAIISTTQGLTGQFSSAELPPLAAGQFWRLQYASGMATLSVTGAGIPGDYNGNGRVDAVDYVVWRKSFVTGNLIADGNGDGTVNAADYGVWRTAYGRSSSGSSIGAVFSAIPEPTGTTIIATAIVFLALRRRRIA